MPAFCRLTAKRTVRAAAAAAAGPARMLANAGASP
jgi:hypothetical protein